MTPSFQKKVRNPYGSSRSFDCTQDSLFGENGDSNLLGAFTLEALGLALDPLGRRLIELPMLI